jgi:alpha-1,3-rhamnosyl/mannosyltransferase
LRLAIDGRYIQDYFPGIARYMYNLVLNLANIVEDEITLYRNPALPNTRYAIESLRTSGKVKLRDVAASTFSPWEQLRLPLQLLSGSIQVFHSPYYIKPYLQPCKSIVTIHDLISAVYPQYMPSPLARMLFEITTRLAIMSSKAIITLSQSSKNDLTTRYGVPPEKVTITYLAADSRFQPRDRTSLDHISRRYGLPERFILYVGINKPHKNVARVIEAFGSAREQSAVGLVIAGREDIRYPEARIIAERSPAKDRIVFLGDVADADLPSLYNLADVFVFPSLYEGFGLPVLEAMASGTPVVCSNRSSLPEVAGDAAVMVDPEKTDELAEAVAKLLHDDLLREQLHHKGLQQAKTFSWQATARQTLDLYKKVAES